MVDNPGKNGGSGSSSSIGSSSNDNNCSASGGAAVYETSYEVKSEREQILHRPDTFCGSAEAVQEDDVVVLDLDSSPPVLVERAVTIVPAVVNLVDELIVNAADQDQKYDECNRIRVSWSKKDGWIQVYNNGRGIPVHKHSKHDNEYIPYLLFARLRSSDNYDDSKARTVGGRNGYGAKLCVLFAKRFKVETSHAETGFSFEGEWRDRSSVYMGSKISAAKKNDFTRVTFWPDWTCFPSLDGWTDDILACIGKRVIDIACTTRPKTVVSLNGTRLTTKRVRDMVQLLQNMYANKYVVAGHGADNAAPNNAADRETGGATHAYCRTMIGARCEVVVMESPTGDFRHMSYVNNIYTKKGGTHVNFVVSQITKEAVKQLRKKFPTLREYMLRQRIWIILNCFVPNPAFTSQTKEELATPSQKFKFTDAPAVWNPGAEGCRVPASFVANLVKKGIFASALRVANVVERKTLKRTDGRKTAVISDVPKLSDANFAGTRRSKQCTLMIVEGDSAKAFAMSGRSVVGSDYYGVFPIKGKPLNVRTATTKQLEQNDELKAIKKIIGLKHGHTYDSVKPLRYGRVMLVCDADVDGSHIKGLLLNMFQTLWPSLYRMPKFLCQFRTPIVRATRKGANQSSVDFYTGRDFEIWERAQRDAGTLGRWTCKYYKGLATSTGKDAQKYFKRIDDHVQYFQHASQSDDGALEMVFCKGGGAQRKQWIAEYGRGADDTKITDLGRVQDMVRYEVFVNKELVVYSAASNKRAIPGFDGLKPAQRKAVYGALQCNVTEDIKVNDASMMFMAKLSYHHGETSMYETVIGMAQTFVGSGNNLNLFVPSGQFGTRDIGGKDHGSPRYIFTRMEEWTPLLFVSDDLPCLEYVRDGGKVVEPVHMAPIIPLVLANGANGISVGWSTTIPSYNPRDIVENVRRMIRGEPLQDMVPYHRGWKGALKKTGAQTYETEGIVEEVEPGVFDITELPIGVWTATYKAHMDKMVVDGILRDFYEFSNDYEVWFRAFVSDDHVDAVRAQPSEYFMSSAIRSQGVIRTSNMVMYDAQGALQRYATPLDILKDFFVERVRVYEARYTHMRKTMQEKLRDTTFKVRFVRAVVDGSLVLSRRTDAQIESDFKRLDIPLSYRESFLRMPLSSVTQRRVDQLQQEHARTQQLFEELCSKTACDLWLADLDRFLSVYEAHESQRAEEYRVARDISAEFASKSRTTSAAAAAATNTAILRSSTNPASSLSTPTASTSPSPTASTASVTTTTTVVPVVLSRKRKQRGNNADPKRGEKTKRVRV